MQDTNLGGAAMETNAPKVKAHNGNSTTTIPLILMILMMMIYLTKRLSMPGLLVLLSLLLM